ncbi:MAG: protein kinase domain-containing protein [Gemmatimonadaceae bacterium]
MSENQKICPTCGTEYPLSERFCPRDGTALRAAANQSDLLGSVVADRYHILKKLGAGGMGTVYLAEHVKMGRKSALKVMNPGMNTDPDAVARFNREASNASRLSHPNICGIYDFGETPDGMIYLAMEFIEGSALTDIIEQGGPLQPARAASIIHQTADALQIAHDAGIVHRDLKPDNIMVAKNRDGSDLVKVVDFGIAKASTSEAQNVTKTGMVVGTPEYMSPEQLAGDKLDGRSDIYALGLVAFNCLTGALPFSATSAQEAMIMRLTDVPRALAEVRPDVAWPEAVQATLDLALARDAKDRYQSAAQFGREFAAALAAMPAHPTDEAGTVVMSAPATVAARAPMPPTRVGGRAAATGGTTTAVAPAPKSKTPLALGGVGAAITIAVVAWKMGLIGGGAATTVASTPPVPSSVAESTSAAPTTLPAPTGSTQLMSNPRTGAGAAGPTMPAATPTGASRTATPPPAPTAGTKTTPAPSQSAGPASTAPVSSAPTPSAPAPAAPSPMTLLEGWLREVQAAAATPATARRVLGDLQQIQGSLAGNALAESYYVQMLAYTKLEDEVGVCRAARQVRALHNERPRINLATRAIELFGCENP